MKKLTLTAIALLSGLFGSAANATEDPELAAELLEVLKQRQAIYDKDPNASGKVLETLWVKDDNIVLVSEEFHQFFHGRDEVTPYFNPPKPNLYAYREF